MVLPVFAFARLMPAKTKAGAYAYMDILGFQEFMSRAEKDKLQRMGDKELFSKFLPYAIALDVVDNWAKAFEGIYQEPPQWYASHTRHEDIQSLCFFPFHQLSDLKSGLCNLLSSERKWHQRRRRGKLVMTPYLGRVD